MSEREGDSNQEGRELARRELPDVSSHKRLKLLRVDGQQAHFVDSEGQPWYFDSNERLWREMVPEDIHPMAIQFTTPEKLTRVEFDDIESAALAALKVHFRQKAELYDTIAEMQKYAAECRSLVELIEKIESEQDQARQVGLKEQFTKLLNKFETGGKISPGKAFQ